MCLVIPPLASDKFIYFCFCDSWRISDSFQVWYSSCFQQDLTFYHLESLAAQTNIIITIHYFHFFVLLEQSILFYKANKLFSWKRKLNLCFSIGTFNKNVLCVITEIEGMRVQFTLIITGFCKMYCWSGICYVSLLKGKCISFICWVLTTLDCSSVFAILW